MAESPADAVACAKLRRLLEPIVTARVLIVAAHPDDETIGAGALLARSVDAHVAVVTDGAPRNRALWPPGVTAATREEYAHLRREELRRALGETGVGERIHLLDVVDGEVALQIPPIVNRLVGLISALQPDLVLTHAYEGAHVDHDATALCVHAAMQLSGRAHPHEMALYHGAGEAIAVHEFLPGGPEGELLRLDERLGARKTAMLAHYASQQHYASYFSATIERYRCAPDYDFRAAPYHGTALLYERSGAGLSGAEWRAQTRAALEALKLSAWLDRSPRGTRPGNTATPDPAAATGIGGHGHPLVSVIVRTIGRNTLGDALASIRSQTYPNIEIVLVDVNGGGPPSSWHDRPGLTLNTRPAPGADRAAAANAGLDGATGRYVAFLDDDDWYHAEHIETLVAALETASGARVAYAPVEVVEWIDRAPLRRWVFDAPYDPVALLCENFIPLNGILVDRALVDEGARFDETLPIYEDWDFLIGLSRRTGFVKTTGITAVYRWPPGSGVTDPQRTGPSQEQVYAKWRPVLSDDEHVAIMRRAIAKTALNDAQQTQMQNLQRHLEGQDAELAWLRSQTAAQARQLDELGAHLRRQDGELEQLRPQVRTQDQQLTQLREHLRSQDHELDRLRPSVTAQEQQLQELRPHLSMQDRELEHLRALTSTRDRELQDAQHRIQKQDQELASLRARLTTQAAELHQITEARAAADAQLAMMQRSKSWRITQPLRTARAWLSGAGRRRSHS